MPKSNKQETKLPNCRVLRLKMESGALMLVTNYPSIQAAATAMAVTPETMYSYCRRIGETLKGSYFMAY